MPFAYDINAQLTAVTLVNGNVVAVNTGFNGVPLTNYKGAVMVELACPVAIGVAPCNYTVRLLNAPNADVNIGAPVANFTIVTNAGGSSVQRVSLDPRALANAYLAAQVNVAGTNINACPVVTLYAFDQSQA